MDKALTLEIRQLETDLLHPDGSVLAERFKALLADDFIEVGATGNRYTKQEILSRLPKLSKVKYNIHDFELSLVSPGTVLATYRSEKFIEENGFKTWCHRSSLWQQRNNRWQMIFHQGTQQEDPD